MTKILTPHEKINLRAWMARCTIQPERSLLLSLPLNEVVNMIPRLTGKSAGVMAKIQPPKVRQTPTRSHRPASRVASRLLAMGKKKSSMLA